jgi:hypothetical protein
MPKVSKEQWRSFSDYLGRALELPESERAQWLAALASTHRDIVAEIERVLAMRGRKGYDEFLSDSPFPLGVEARVALFQSFLAEARWAELLPDEQQPLAASENAIDSPEPNARQ